MSAALLLAPLTKIGDMQVGLAVDIVGGLIFVAVLSVNSMMGGAEGDTMSVGGAES